MKVAKADSVQMSVEKNLILAGLEEHGCSLQALVNANVKRKVTLMDAMTTLRKLLESDCTISKSDNSVNISNLTREIQRLTCLVESEDLACRRCPAW